MNSDVMHIFRISEQSQNTSMCFDLEEKPGTSYQAYRKNVKMKDVLYFEAKNQKNIHSWYLKIGDHIRDKLSDSCYISEEADDPYEPDYRIDTFLRLFSNILIYKYLITS
ncbi:MAG: hypothetical protein GY749_47935 [Desulfobacteraceae bacterium]|nr:hypothetical protein [Desulfobacteraceae bacterium]